MLNKTTEEDNMKSHKFNYDLSSLTQYTEEQVLPLVTESLYSARTAQLVRIQTGIKYKEVINIMADEVFIQDGATCGFNASGDTTFSQREIQVGSLKVDKSWCIQDLEDYWMQTQLTPGSIYNGMPFEQAFSEYFAGLIGQANETNIWQSSTTANGLYNGFIKIIDDAGTAIAGNTGSETSITASNVISIFDNIMAAIPSGVDSKPDLAIMCGWDTFKILIQALRTANNFYYDGVDGNPYKTGDMTLPGWGVPVHAVHGLDGTNRIFAGRTSNFVIGTDLSGDSENFLFWMRDDKETFALKVRWKLGTQVAFPDEIVQYTNA